MLRRALNWHPGHMAKAIRDFDASLRHANLVVEVRDARLPFSS